MVDGISNKTGRLPDAAEGSCGRPIRRGQRRGLPCSKPAGMGTDHLGDGPCRYHGGLTPRGAKHHAFKHGRYSKHWATVGEKLEKAIQDLASDPDYLHLRRHIATLDFLFLQELGQLDGDTGGGGWDKARALTVDIRMALSGGNAAAAMKALKQLQALADSGVRRDKSLTRIQSLLRDRVSTTRADQARVEAEQAYATVDQLKDIALMSATSVASQLDLFMRQLTGLLTEAERMRVQAPFDKLRRETLQGVSESFRRALVGRALLPSGNGGESPPSSPEVIDVTPNPDPAPTQAQPTDSAPHSATQDASGTSAKAVPIPGIS